MELILCIVTISIISLYFLYPYFHKKYLFWRWSRKIKKIADKNEIKAKEKLSELSDLLKKLNK